MREILVLGGSGQVGTALGRLALPKGVGLVAPPRSTCDLADSASVAATVAARPWAAVINAAAYTAVDRAETEIAAAWTLNALGPAVLAEATARAGIPLVHVSTDYVFSGALDRPYREDDPIGPIGVYGASKEGGEQAVRTAHPRHAILRTAWLVSPYGTNFLKTMLRLAAEREEIRVVADQIGCPTSADDVAEALLAAALRLADDPAAPTGTFHAVNAGETTWAGFASAIMAASAARGGPSARIVPITTADYPTPARRPANSRLATDRLAAAFDIRLRPWQEATEAIVAELSG